MKKTNTDIASIAGMVRRSRLAMYAPIIAAPETVGGRQ
jgi:hypothetical protein